MEEEKRCQERVEGTERAFGDCADEEGENFNSRTKSCVNCTTVLLVDPVQEWKSLPLVKARTMDQVVRTRGCAKGARLLAYDHFKESS